jgi:hypothetical protein
MVPLTPQAIRKVGHRYQQGGLERELYEKQRPGAAEVVNAATLALSGMSTIKITSRSPRHQHEAEAHAVELSASVLTA